MSRRPKNLHDITREMEMWLERESWRIKHHCPDCGLFISLCLFPAWQRGGLVGPHDTCQDCARVLSSQQLQALLDEGHAIEELRRLFPSLEAECA